MRSDEVQQDFSNLGEFLDHHGVRGMKWGVRKRRNESKRSRTFGSKGKKPVDPLKDMSDKDLREILNRMQMEQQYRSLTTSRRKNAGAEFAKSIALNVARTQATNAVNAQIAKALSGRASRK